MYVVYTYWICTYRGTIVYSLVMYRYFDFLCILYVHSLYIHTTHCAHEINDRMICKQSWHCFILFPGESQLASLHRVMLYIHWTCHLCTHPLVYIAFPSCIHSACIYFLYIICTYNVYTMTISYILHHTVDLTYIQRIYHLVNIYTLYIHTEYVYTEDILFILW